MITTISEELYIFLATVYGGILIGLVYDFYRIFRGIFKPKKIATIVEDLVFWVIIGVIAFLVLLYSNDGELRLYTFLGFSMGSLLYIWILSHYVIKIVISLVNQIKKYLLKTYRIVILPFKKLVQLFKGPWLWGKKKLKPLSIKIKKIKQLPKRLIKALKKEVKIIIGKK